MPYTPPTPSPGASPVTSRSASFSYGSGCPDAAAQSTMNLLNTSNPPRSATYLHKHRRSSSVSTLPAPQILVKDPRSSESLHQSPPPTDTGLSIPPGAVMSPPDSSQNSSDEDDQTPLRRGRDLGRLEVELKEAISRIEQRRVPSPDRSGEIPRPASAPVVDDEDTVSLQVRRRISHSRSQSESVLADIGMSGGSSRSDSMSEPEDDGYSIAAPPMIRKKSGEVVKSSLKSPSRSRPISAPSTPTFSKHVIFDPKLEHVRHFLHSEKPSAVSAGSSPVETAYDGESEYPWDEEEKVEWELGLPNFPSSPESRKSMMCRLEKLNLSADQKNLIGTVAVQNISFQKHVTARFTFDYWQTTSEVVAEYSSDVRRRDRDDGADRFVFRINLSDHAKLETKTMFICICYRTSGQEFWDNNGGYNFQVDFKKKMVKPPVPSRGVVGPSRNTLPRSRPSHPVGRPRSMSNNTDLSTDDGFFRKNQELGKQKNVIADEEDTALPARRANPSSNAFSGRYDFSASLSAAKKAINAGQQKNRSSPSSNTENRHSTGSYFDFAPRGVKAQQASSSPKNDGKLDELKLHKPSIESPSYQELINNYCFVSWTVSAPETLLTFSRPLLARP